MAQIGLHGIIGLALARAIRDPGHHQGVAADLRSTRETWNRSAARWGVVAGSLWPDADVLLAAPFFVFNPEIGYALHRTFSHSILIQTAAALIVYGIGARCGTPGAKGLALGLWLGVVLHSLVDIFLWFRPVDLLWPLSLFGLPSVVNLWTDVHLSVLVKNLLGAAEFLALTVFYLYLRTIINTSREGAGRDDAHRLRHRLTIISMAHLLLFMLMLIPAWLLDGTPFLLVNFGILLMIGVPILVWSLLRARPWIETGP